MKRGYKCVLGERGDKGMAHCSLLGHGNLERRGISNENVGGVNPHGELRGTRGPGSRNPRVPQPQTPPSLPLLLFPEILPPLQSWTFLLGQGIAAQTSQQWRHPEVHPTWLNFKAQVAVWNQCSRVKGWG